MEGHDRCQPGWIRRLNSNGVLVSNCRARRVNLLANDGLSRALRHRENGNSPPGFNRRARESCCRPGWCGAEETKFRNVLLRDLDHFPTFRQRPLKSFAFAATLLSSSQCRAPISCAPTRLAAKIGRTTSFVNRQESFSHRVTRAKSGPPAWPG
jgi:hypothetical protein